MRSTLDSAVAIVGIVFVITGLLLLGHVLSTPYHGRVCLQCTILDRIFRVRPSKD